MHTEAIHLHQPGGAAALQPARIHLAAPGPGEALLRHAAIGVNYVDVYHRSGRHPLPPGPAVLGVEAAGVVEAVGAGVEGVAVGDRVAWAGGPPGGYVGHRLIAADRLVRLPATLGDDDAAVLLLRGTTAHMLLARGASLRAGDAVLIHAAAGGLGLLLTRWAKRLGLRTIGTVSSAARAEVARANGLDRAVNYRAEDFVQAVRDWTGGEGVALAIDGVGGDTLRRSLDAVRPSGTLASIGQVGGDAAPAALAELARARSVALARPSVLRFMEDAARYREGAAAVLAAWRDGVRVPVAARYALRDAAEAHRALEGGRHDGAIVLKPSR
ncbi:quinone oxidoreductase [Anaeromyxobacter sp. PSR-1]|uniref:quinone oxidoreductase family protein n=1 Tax=Anaeromyxobacter sp. PSR-1 TaxID=1300915 RepID=UPI0005E22798|nr:quinone oxidoreductase [Anaeromyxobacter sp. PSR-1]GAO04015.1 quinone oxidoreductase [Anaeromyxobacter sp. PSR-1]